MARAGGEDDHASLVEVAEGPATDEGLGDVFHFDGGHDAGLNSGMFEGVLEGEGVDDRGEHAHVISGVAVHPALPGGGGAPPDVSSSDDDGKLEGGRENVADLVGKATRDGLGEVIAGFGESFAGKFQKETTPTIGRVSLEGVRPYFAPNSCGDGASKGLPGKFKGGATGDGVFGFLFFWRWLRGHKFFLAEIGPRRKKKKFMGPLESSLEHQSSDRLTDSLSMESRKPRSELGFNP